MRWSVGLLAMLLIVILFALTATDSPPDGQATTQVAAPVNTTTSYARRPVPVVGPSVQEDLSWIVGALPDGTEFAVKVEPIPDVRVTGIQAVIVIDVERQPMSVGTLDFFGSWTEVPVFQGGMYRPSRSGVTIGFYDDALAVLGDDAEDIIRSSIRGGSKLGYPTLELDPPFRWATDQEQPFPMEVTTVSFSIRRGCGPLAVACSSNGAVQVIPLDRLYAPAPAWTEAVVFVESPDS